MTDERTAASVPHACQRCGSDELTYVDYGGCSDCRPYEERAAGDEEDKVAEWVAWALTTPLRHGLTTFGGSS
jgi:hypothetical protein